MPDVCLLQVLGAVLYDGILYFLLLVIDPVQDDVLVGLVDEVDDCWGLRAHFVNDTIVCSQN